MSNRGRNLHEERVLVFAPTGRDAALATRLLSNHGLDACECGSITELCARLRAGAGAALIAEEGLARREAISQLAHVLEDQPPWSDFPLIVFAACRPTDAAAALPLAILRNVTLVERPVRVRSLVTVVKAALRSRRRQYQVRNLLNRLADADRKKDQFLAVLGHKLRNPLGVIRMALELLEDEGAENLHERLEVMGRQATALTRMVDDLLDVTRILTGKIRLKRQLVDINRTAADAVAAVRADNRSRNRHIEVERDSKAIWVWGDPVRLEQIFVNILENAVKYTDDGGHVTLRLESADGQVRIRFADDGMGISAPMLERVFEAFEQVPQPGQRPGGGLGLGLPLVRNLVQLHGGDVNVESDGEGKGSTFTVELPIAPSQPEHLPEELSEPGQSGPVPRKRRILLVEDNPDALQMLEQALRSWGHQVQTASDAETAIERLERFRADVGLLDIGLPGMNGYELARHIRGSVRNRNMMLLAMTGFGQYADRKKAMDAGFDQHLVKPIDLGKLRTMLAGDLAVKERNAASLEPSAPLSRRLLVVDDDPDSADTLAMVLRKMGFDVDVAFDGPQALKLARQMLPAVALLDLELPGMSGFELAVELRAALGPCVHLLAVTGYGDEQTRQELVKSGFDRHLVKPVDWSCLRSLVDGLLARPNVA